MRLILFLASLALLSGCAARHMQRPTVAEEKLMVTYYGKPYLEAPKGWHWVCSFNGVPSERCFIDKN